MIGKICHKRLEILGIQREIIIWRNISRMVQLEVIIEIYRKINNKANKKIKINKNNKAEKIIETKILMIWVE